MKKLIVVAAPSGAGKTTLCKRLLADFPQFVLSISSTTRPPRGSEKDGVDYFFITQEQFKDQVQNSRFAEWALVHGNYYGTSKEFIERAFNQDRPVLLDIDVQGAESLRQAYPKQCYTVFIVPPSLEALEARLRARGTDSEESIRKRLRNAEHEMQHLEHFHKVIINDQFDHAYAELKAAVEKELKET